MSIAARILALRGHCGVADRGDDVGSCAGAEQDGEQAGSARRGTRGDLVDPGHAVRMQECGQHTQRRRVSVGVDNEPDARGDRYRGAERRDVLRRGADGRCGS
ncbi:hypothetical protein [Flexivirga alba]|uniref:Uncharacterized protein n=1 Tax=Flexivirga alba TaxID=702742 RepID=A0ABW2ADR0_9MICO